MISEKVREIEIDKKRNKTMSHVIESCYLKL
jgi:hypothetical protein